ncbi:eukaryotic translation initiation factor 4e class ii 2b [Anaeramoeba flamelloides]|uniref:Eukaryotic translation initiation factor 4e class ii 2b n=1 Tax=Anaeramoeba flamelloides TaxID=1746091 RepID=A0AAV7YT89_9EUKA|nr:eukaryotic translation initiation factor 4e class ii 2b [Anaeramoeba flamelloides]KAJ6242156.1 eukaryotic translation initiation factor 4e class ii 2b [Anaeramoeba flamelloides]
MSTTIPNLNKEEETEKIEKKIHKLQSKYRFSFVKRESNNSQISYQDRIKSICTFDTAEDFWGFYSHLVRPNDIAGDGGDYLLFKDGIDPVWEDPENEKGGKWILRLRKGLASRFYEDLILALIGEEFDVAIDEICGIVVSVRTQEDIISLWNKRGNDKVAIENLKKKIIEVLGLPKNAILFYKTHNRALQDNTSYKQNNNWRGTKNKGRGRGRGKARGRGRGRERGKEKEGEIEKKKK